MGRIFEFKWENQGEREWVYANTLFAALKFYLNHTEMDLCDIDDDDDIIEIPEEKWDDYSVINTEFDEHDPDDWKEMTFREFVKDEKWPIIVAGTMYE